MIHDRRECYRMDWGQGQENPMIKEKLRRALRKQQCVRRRRPAMNLRLAG